MVSGLVLVLLACAGNIHSLRPTHSYVRRRLAAYEEETGTDVVPVDDAGSGPLLPLEPSSSSHPEAKQTCESLDHGLKSFVSIVQRDYDCVGELNYNDCCMLKFLRGTSGVFRVQQRLAWCDMDTDHGGWLVILRRANGRRDFHKRWRKYRRGFGFLNRDFWYGLDAIHELTNTTKMELRVDLRYANGTELFAHYGSFSVAGPDDEFRLTIGDYDEASTAPDSFSSHNQMQFTTIDRDNDQFIINCAIRNTGGWWFRNCGVVHLTMDYDFSRPGFEPPGVLWSHGFNPARFVFAEMKIRPANMWHCGTAEASPPECPFLRNIAPLIT